MQLPYECEIPFHRRTVDATCIFGLDASGRPGLVSVDLHLGPAGGLRFNKGQKFDRVAAYLRATCWEDILLQFEIRRQEIEALAERFERLCPPDRIEAAMAAVHAAKLRAYVAPARRAG